LGSRASDYSRAAFLCSRPKVWPQPLSWQLAFSCQLDRETKFCINNRILVIPEVYGLLVPLDNLNQRGLAAELFAHLLYGHWRFQSLFSFGLDETIYTKRLALSTVLD